jgi:methenyltetrahydrofolate cyclohydrolase
MSTRAVARLASSDREAFTKQTVQGFLTALAADRPAPSGGAAAALGCALAAALVEMAAGLTRAGGDLDVEAIRQRASAARAAAADLADADPAAYAQVLAALALPRDHSERAQRLAGALSGAADVPLAIAREAADVAELAADLVGAGNPSLRGDALTGTLLAEAAALAAARLVEINLASTPGDDRVERARALAARALSARERALS